MIGASALRLDGDGFPMEGLRRSFFEKIAAGLKYERLSYPEYVPKAWPLIVPATRFIENWHIDCIAEHLQAVLNGDIQDLVINVPPRSGKSNLVSVLWPTWAWTEQPWLQWIFISYGANLATKHSIDRRRIMESDWYQDRWGSVCRIQSDQNSKVAYENTARGVMMATSATGSATGFGADILVFDDFIHPKLAESKVEREKYIELFDVTFATRLNDKKRGHRIIVEQRLHSDDLTAHVLKQSGWTHLCLPAIADHPTTVIFPISGRVIEREAGDILNPQREGLTELTRQKTVTGSRGFSAQYQQSPSLDTGNMIKRQWFKFYDEDPRELVKKMDVVIQSWDFAFKDNDDSSYVVGLVMGRRGADKFLFAEYRDHMDFPKTIQAVRLASKQWAMAGHKLYEDRANGPAVKASLGREVTGLIPVEPTGSKEARMAAASPDIEAGNYYLPDPSRPGNEWVNDYINELAMFPDEPNDRGDATAQGIVKLNQMIFVSDDVQEEGSMMEGLDQFEAGANEVMSDEE